MYDLIVYGSTDRKGKALVALEGGHGPRLAYQLFGQLVQVQGGDAGFDLPAQSFQHVVQQHAGLAHLLYL